LLYEGPKELFRFYGYSDFAVKAYLNSINLDVKGKKEIIF
jgi:hypothetical protein